MKLRTDKMLQAMPVGFEAALISTETNRFYLLGFDSGDAGTVLVLPNKTYFIIDSRYIEIAEKEVADTEIVLQTNALKQVQEILQSHGVKNLYMENKTTVAYLDEVRAALPGITIDASALLSDALDDVRAIKGEDEVAIMKKAQKITDDCFRYIITYIKPGMREIDVALEMEMYMRSHGAGKLAFPTILVTGQNTSLPHGVPGETLIQTGDFVTMDFGANVDGYCTDMTRTIAVGRVSDEQKHAYETVHKAQLAAVEFAKAGQRGCEVDKVARDIINDAGYEGCFGHGLGHAVGIEIHENPRYSPTCETVIRAGMMMTIEPGVYLAGKFGLRIEDTLLIREDGCEMLGNSDKNLIIL